MTRLRAVSLFSGCGGLDLGFRDAGFDIILANDNDKYCAESHAANFPETPFLNGSVAELTPSVADTLTDGALDGGIDVLIGGPPCPPYSKSRFYRKDKPRGLSDPIGAETLKGYVDTLRWLSPRSFLLENVPGFAYGVHRESLDYVTQSAEELGYRCDYRVLNAADYGVPQIRQRFIMIGVKEGEFIWPPPTHTKRDLGAERMDHLPGWITAGDAISELDTDENADDTGHVAGGKHHHLLEEIPPGDNYLHFTEKRGHPNPQFAWRSRYWSFLLKLSPDLPSWTIQARRSNNMGPLHWRNRILRIEEVKRLQTFPDDWVLSGTIERQWRQVGNAVPPLLARHMAEALARTLRTAMEADPQLTV